MQEGIIMYCLENEPPCTKGQCVGAEYCFVGVLTEEVFKHFEQTQICKHIWVNVEKVFSGINPNELLSEDAKTLPSNLQEKFAFDWVIRYGAHMRKVYNRFLNKKVTINTKPFSPVVCISS